MTTSAPFAAAAAAAGVDRAEEFDARDLFAEVTRSRKGEEIEDHFTCGTRATTPPLAEVDARWPKPWVFARVFGFALALYAGFAAMWGSYHNVNLVPGLIMAGSFAVPFSLLIFFFEMNVPRNVSPYQVVRLLLTGAVVSFGAALWGFSHTGLGSVLGAASAGVIEEVAKGLVLLLLVRRARYPWTLNGLLFGAAVGTGFAAFESAGYALNAALAEGADAMTTSIMLRGFLSVFGGHVLWTGLVGAALWRVRGDRPFDPAMLADPRFLRVFAFAVAMHMAWNTEVPLVPSAAKFAALGAVAWLLVLGMIQDGLKQVRAAQAAVGALAPA